MWIDPKVVHKGADLANVLRQQLEMWRYESHCWVTQADGSLRCEWCGKQRIGNFSTASNSKDRNFPLCEQNPVVDFLIKSKGDQIASGIREIINNHMIQDDLK
jgi:hypothetical protein